MNSIHESSVILLCEREFQPDTTQARKSLILVTPICHQFPSPTCRSNLPAIQVPIQYQPALAHTNTCFFTPCRDVPTYSSQTLAARKSTAARRSNPAACRPLPVLPPATHRSPPTSSSLSTVTHVAPPQRERWAKRVSGAQPRPWSPCVGAKI